MTKEVTAEIATCRKTGCNSLVEMHEKICAIQRCASIPTLKLNESGDTIRIRQPVKYSPTKLVTNNTAF